MSKPLKKKATQQQQNTAHKKWIRYAGIPAVIGFILYLPALSYEFIPNWDDGGYILNNPVIQSLNWNNLVEIFTAFYKGNYHPLTTLLYALTYSLAGTDPVLYHLINILLHTFNIILVFLLIQRLFQNEWMAFWVAIIFGVHPMHIESVAWISELKDVMYSCFYLLALLAYQRYISLNDRKRYRFFLLSLFFFLFSLASKSAAVTLSVLLFLIDWISHRKINWITIAEKVPFLLLSLVFGIIAILSQGKQGAIQDLAPLYTAGERIFIVSYAIMVYVVKFVAPFSLSAMYPYPARTGDMLPWEVYASLPAILILAGLLLWSLRKSKLPVFGALFFLITAALTLQIIPVGGAVVAERYTYIPYIGLSIIALFALGNKYGLSPFKFNWQHAVLIGYTAFLIIVSFLRMPVWNDGITLFNDVIQKYPNLPFAYNNRGYAYQTYYKDDEKAFQDYNRAIAIDSTYHQSLSNRGVLYHSRGQYEEAILDFSRSLRYNPRNTDAWIGRANTLSMLQRYQEALPDYDAYLQLKPQHAQAWLWRAVAKYHTGRHQEAIDDLRVCLSMEPVNDEAFYWIGINYHALDQADEAINNLKRSLEINPRRTQAFIWLGIVQQSSGEYNAAIESYSNALAQSPNDYSSYFNRAVCYAEIREFRLALADLDKAIALGYPVNMTYYQDISIRSKMQAER